MNIASILSSRLSTAARVGTPGSADFANSDLRYTQYGRPSYSVSVMPASEEDVVETVKFCHERGISFAARSGHHCVTTSMRHLREGILIDMRALSKIELNDAKDQASCQGGLITEDLVSFLHNHHREVTIGSCPTTGVIGVAFGAGLGRLQGKYGYLHDNLISCRLVLADGTVVTASEDSNPGLFWAVRGAGHNFGICLEATFRVYEQAHNGIHYSWDLEYRLDQCDDVFKTINEVHASMPADLAIFVVWRRESPKTGLKHLILVNLVWSGPEEGAATWVERFERSGPVYHSGKVTTTWPNLPWETYGGMNKMLSRPEKWELLPYKMMSAVNVKSFDLDTTRAFFESVKAMNEKRDGKGWFGAMFECLPNQQTRALPSDATAFPWRGTDHFLMMTATPRSLDDRDEFEAHLDEWKAKFVNVSGYGRLCQYVNYGSTTVTVQDPAEAMYGYEPWRLEKLRLLKRKYDPGNVFRWYQPFV
ncbi:hypothetical protein CBER1_02190 [Cercospora berteroae]|uniref:FAD-binding PCMH-type domain-containing protein n=1 Tax=Cercospora berteroae TaxID=357750 RepID=A0A2S6BQ78_9PEZI|nr:hypothetical protein CBER1_02190 [Cercospora berteroae]